MKTFNIWECRNEWNGPTGPWKFASACIAKDEQEALETAKMRHGLDGKFKVYEGL